MKDVLKIAVTESLEEGAQSLADDLIHNEIVDAADGRAADGAVSPGDMAVRALVRTVEAFPVGVGFGLAAPLGSAGAALRHARRLSSAQAREEVQVQHTLTGTVMLEGLQQVSSSAKLRQTAPDVQEKVIRAQVQGSPFEAAYVDTVAALQSPEGAKDLEAVARAAGISDEELSLTIAREGLEKYAQSAASPALLEAVSFSPEADSIARMKMNARALTDAMEQAQKVAVKARTQAMHAICMRGFPRRLCTRMRRSGCAAMQSVRWRLRRSRRILRVPRMAGGCSMMCLRRSARDEEGGGYSPKRRRWARDPCVE